MNADQIKHIQKGLETFIENLPPSKRPYKYGAEAFADFLVNEWFPKYYREQRGTEGEFTHTEMELTEVDNSGMLSIHWKPATVAVMATVIAVFVI